MRILVLGCGNTGKEAIRDLFGTCACERIGIASRHPERAEEVAATLKYGRSDVVTHEIDVQDHDALVRLMREYEAVANLAGPNFQNAVPVAKAAIAAGVPLVDVMDDWETALEMFELDSDARAAGVTIVTGLGASPGATDLMARAGVERLDHAQEIRTSWVMRSSDPGGPALAKHLLYSLPQRAFVYENSEMREVVPFKDGAEVIDFPLLGKVEVFHIGHPEPFMLAHTFPGIRYADDKATFLPARVNDWIVELGAVARPNRPIAVDGKIIDSMDWAAETFLRRCGEILGELPFGALRAEVKGESCGKQTRIVFDVPGQLGYGTGIPASIGAQLLAKKQLHKPGVHPPEACIDPDLFFEEVEKRSVDEIRETWIEE